MRIVSLLPSATEIICQLGLESELVGVTHECDYPPSVRHLPKVTRTLIPADATSREIDSLVREQLKTKQALYTLDLTVLRDLQPDLIVTQALCDVCAVAESEVLRRGLLATWRAARDQSGTNFAGRCLRLLARGRPCDRPRQAGSGRNRQAAGPCGGRCQTSGENGQQAARDPA